MRGTEATKNDVENFQKSLETIIPRKHWEVLYTNKISDELAVKDKFEFTDMNLLLTAYEQWRYEKA